MKIFNRFKKLQRNKSTHLTSQDSNTQSSKGRPKKVQAMSWTFVPVETNSNEKIQTAIEELKVESTKGKKTWKNKRIDGNNISKEKSYGHWRFNAYQ